MSRVEIILWPVVGFLIVAALATVWQARDARTARLRSLLFAGLAIAILVFLLTRS